MTKREFLRRAGFVGALAPLGSIAATACTSRRQVERAEESRPIALDVEPISVSERQARVHKAQSLMRDAGVVALVLEPGSSMLYFTGIDWRRSERLTAVLIPNEGEIGVVTPHFEEPSVRERMSFGDDVRTWHEHENPFRRVAEILEDRRPGPGAIAFESTVRHFVADGVRRAVPQREPVSGASITNGCRMVKSPHELRLMQKAADVTVAAYRSVALRIEAGMTPEDIAADMARSTEALGATHQFALVLAGEASAYPHGSNKPQVVREGEVLLMDCGCSVHGYQSDISRTMVLGEATKRQREIWDTVRRGQQLAFETAQPGTPAGKVDDTVRAWYTSLGFGPDYETPGLPHRLGHGIGMDGHEPINFVRGETTGLAPGMCLSNEPGIYIYGEFGVRLEDCIHITAEGPRWFTEPPPSIDEPFA
ncbi:MAG: M24 family metallopeptidase [Gammaproteobacteria bacterium]